MIRFTSALRRQITEDWRKLFPQMAIYQPMWLARRIGPLIQGICLERDSGSGGYFPTTHLHNLCRSFPVLSLSMAQRLLNERSGTQERIPVQFHEQRYGKAAQQLAQASLLPLTGDLNLHQVLDAQRAYRELNRPDSKYPVLLFEDGVLLAAWSGQHGRAEELLNQHTSEMRYWPANVLTRYGGVDSWKTKMLEKVENPKELQITAESQEHKLKVTNLPFAQFL
jgi:hypothetical protein